MKGYGSCWDSNPTQRGHGLLLTDSTEVWCVYEVARRRVADLLRAAIALPAVRVLHAGTLMRALELYEVVRLDFAEAYRAASAELTGVATVVSFDRSLDRLESVRRLEP